MNRIRHISRIAAVLASLAAALAAFGVTPAFARPVPPRGTEFRPSAPGRTVTHTVVIGGMPGWQIALIAVGAALLAATVAVLADQARAARRQPIPAAA